MTEREMFRKFDNASENELNTKTRKKFMPKTIL